jgi:hypothetical protein
LFGPITVSEFNKQAKFRTPIKNSGVGIMAFESVHNYYENLVFTEIRQVLKKRKLSADYDDYIEDVACVALNRLPTRYVRHHVDLAFYLTAEEHEMINDSVKTAVADAFTFVDRHRR